MARTESVLTAALHTTVGGLCQYEVAALLSQTSKRSRVKLPTLTRLCARHKWLAPILLTGLGVHLYRKSWRAVEEAIEVIEAVAEIIEEENK